MGNQNTSNNEENDPEDMLKLLSPFSAYFESKLDRNEMIIFRDVKEKGQSLCARNGGVILAYGL